MGIYIKGLTEEQFKLVSWEGVYTALKRQDRIIEVAEPHGRLIDADEVKKAIGDAHFKNWGDAAILVMDAPTVIEREGE